MPKKYYWIIPLVLGCALFLPMLGSYGLWDPIEIRDADVAQELIEPDTGAAEAKAATGQAAKKGGLWDVTFDGKFNARPPLYVWMVALGFKLFGVNELAGRLPLALIGILTLLLAYRVGRRLFDERAGLACALVLATAPVFLFQCRQLSSDVIYYASLLAAAGGMAAYIWPASGKRCPVDLTIAGVGLVAGFLSRGLLLGTLFPLVAVGVAVALSWRTPDRVVENKPEDEEDGEDDPVEPEKEEAEEKAGDEEEAEKDDEEKEEDEEEEEEGDEEEDEEESEDEARERVASTEERPRDKAHPYRDSASEPASKAEEEEEEDDDAGLDDDPVEDTNPGYDVDLEALMAEEQAEPEPPVPTLGDAVRSATKNLAIMLGASALVIVVMLLMFKGTKFMVLGGIFRRLDAPPTFETIFKSFGFGFYPWFALLPVALGTFVLAQAREAASRDRGAFIKMLILSLTVGGYVVSSLWLGYLGKVRYPAMPWAAMAVGVLIYDIWTARSVVHRFWGLVAAGLILVIQQDYFMNPDGLAFAHLVEHAKYPIELKIKTEMRVFGILLALLMFFSLGGAPAPIGRNFSDTFAGRVARKLAGLLDRLGDVARLVVGPNNRHMHIATGLVALVFAGWCSFYLTPQLSLHLSNKALFQTFHRCRTGNEALAQYQVSGKGAAYYNNGKVKAIHSTEQLFQHLKKPKRWFVLVPAHQLAPIDKEARQRKITYYVLDDRSSQFLILSNKLGQKACKKDRNPLRKYVLSTAPKPGKLIRNKEGKVIKPNFENRVQLLGYDVKDEVRRGGKFQLKLYFKVLGSMPSQYKIFVHFDQPASRFHGDHKPLGGKFPTEYWMPGDYIVDPHDVEIPIITTPSGTYTMYMGFWLGSQRLKLTDPAHHDGVNRVNLGRVRVK